MISKKVKETYSSIHWCGSYEISDIVFAQGKHNAIMSMWQGFPFAWLDVPRQQIPTVRMKKLT